MEVSLNPVVDEGPVSCVALVSPGWPPEAFQNGINSYVASLESGLRQMGVRVEVLALRKAGDSESGDNVRRLEEQTPRMKGRGSLIRRVSRRLLGNRSCGRRDLAVSMQSLIREVGVQLVEVEESFGLPLALIGAIDVPVVARLHGPWFLNGQVLGVERNREYYRRVREEGRGIAGADGVSAPSRDVLSRTCDYYGFELSKASVIPNPIETRAASDHWHLENCRRNRLLFIGRFDSHKGGDVMIEAFRKILEQNIDAELDMVCRDDGCMDPSGRLWRLEEYVHARLPGRFRERVRWLGPKPRSCLDSLRREALVTVIPSRYETFGYTAVEAMAVGAPVVVSGIGGLAEIVDNERTGLIAAPGDAADLALQLIRLLRDPDLARRLGKAAARACVAHFSPAQIAEQTIAFYREVARAAAGRRRRRWRARG